MTPLVARQLEDTTTPAEVLLIPIHCHACGHVGLTQLDHGAGGTRRTWTGRCPDCHAETVVIVDYVAIQPHTREFAEFSGQGP